MGFICLLLEAVANDTNPSFICQLSSSVMSWRGAALILVLFDRRVVVGGGGKSGLVAGS